MAVKLYIEIKKRKKDNPEREVPIIISVTSPEFSRILTTTGEKIKPANWDKERQRVKKSATYSLEINDYLDSLLDKINNYMRRCRILDQPIQRTVIVNLVRNITEVDNNIMYLLDGLNKFIEQKITGISV